MRAICATIEWMRAVLGVLLK
jgi:hypothetical protein